MTNVNSHILQLESSYLFPKIEEKRSAHMQNHPEVEVLNLGVGDISLPLAKPIVEALKTAADEMGSPQSIHGYGPEAGYAFLREAIAEIEYAELPISAHEIFISDGITSDLSNIRELFARDIRIGVLEPSYPAHLDLALMHTDRSHIISIPCLEENGFIPTPPSKACDLIYLCDPNNPTGTALNHEGWAKWIEYAHDTGTIIVRDNAYASFAQNLSSVYEIPGAREVVIESRSFSKGAGFTGLRCGYLIFPDTIDHLYPHWKRCQTSKSNGVSYPIQRAAQAALSPEGLSSTRAQITTYKASAQILTDALKRSEQTYYGGVDSPYIFWKTPDALSSWEFFDLLLEHGNLIAIPGSGFGLLGEGFIRLSTFIKPDIALKAAKRIEEVLRATCSH